METKQKQNKQNKKKILLTVDTETIFVREASS